MKASALVDATSWQLTQCSYKQLDAYKVTMVMETLASATLEGKCLQMEALCLLVTCTDAFNPRNLTQQQQTGRWSPSLLCWHGFSPKFMTFIKFNKTLILGIKFLLPSHNATEDTEINKITMVLTCKIQTAMMWLPKSGKVEKPKIFCKSRVNGSLWWLNSKENCTFVGTSVNPLERS